MGDFTTMVMMPAENDAVDGQRGSCRACALRRRVDGRSFALVSQEADCFRRASASAAGDSSLTRLSSRTPRCGLDPIAWIV